MGLLDGSDYTDIKPMGTQPECPVCHKQCSNWTAAQKHCQNSSNSKDCPNCRGSGLEYGSRCKRCKGTGKIGLYDFGW